MALVLFNVSVGFKVSLWFYSQTQMPPLPAKPVVEPKDAHSRSKRQLGNRSKILMGDEFHKDCRSLAK